MKQLKRFITSFVENLFVEFLRVWAIIIISVRRILTQRLLACATALGVTTAVALTMSVPLYADSVYQYLLLEEVGDKNTSSLVNRPPFALMFQYASFWSGSVYWEQVWSADKYLTTRLPGDLGLPRKLLVRFFKTEYFELFSQHEAYGEASLPLEWANFIFMSDLNRHVEIVEGGFPAPASSDPSVPMDVLVSESFALKLGIQMGDTFTALGEIGPRDDQTKVEFPIRVVGVWRANDVGEQYWFINPTEITNAMLVPEQTYVNRIAPATNNQVYQATWYMIMDGSKVQSSDVPALLKRFTTAKQRAYNYLPEIRLDVSPEEKLKAFGRTAGSLSRFLYAFSAPLLVMMLMFISQVVSMAVGQRQNEIAVFRSRGGTVLQILGMAILEGLLLGLVSVVFGLPIAHLVANIFSKTRSFLDFSAQTNLVVNFTISAARVGLAFALFSLIAQLQPSFSAAQHTILTYKQEQARQMRQAWWQRAWLDVLLLIPTAYGVYMLRQETGARIPLLNRPLSADPFQNPLLLMVPALGIFALTLLILRILPIFMSLFAWLASKTKSVGILLAVRHLARTAGFYNAPLILLIFTLSLSIFTATLAQTLDRHLVDQVYYRVGADMMVEEQGDSTEEITLDMLMGNFSTNSTESSGESKWLFLPVSEHLKVPGVKAASRVARMPITLATRNGPERGLLIGIDRIDFSQVTFWRRDFAPVSLGALMNNLALTTEGALVSQRFMSSNDLEVGDVVMIDVDQFGAGVVYDGIEFAASKSLEIKIVGFFDFFPSWYPDEGPLIVGNLDYISEQLGSELPYDVWLHVDPDRYNAIDSYGNKYEAVDYDAILSGIQKIFLRIMKWEIAQRILSEEQNKPERQGLFGLLSVGFVALTLLTVVGFLLYALFSFRRRYIEMGMLRAIGLSVFQMILFLAAELALLLLIGLVAGTVLGVWISNLFIPYLQIGGGGMATRVLPYLIEIDWSSVFQIYILFGALFVAALGVLTFMLVRIKIFQAVKMGEAV